MAKLRRTVASYEAHDPAVACDFDKRVLRNLVGDAIADIGTLADLATDLLGALKAAEAFIAGFEDDETQDGMAELLDMVRGPITKASDTL
jgi:hypothetical protein